MKKEKINFNGWADSIRLANNDIELVITTAIGPRISRLGYIGEKNLFAEIAGQQGTHGESEWQLRGGHRFWIAPEVKPDTYELDNTPIATEDIDNGIKTLQPPGPILGISKTMDISLDSENNKVKIVHTLHNQSEKAHYVAPWALSVMAPGGMEVIPLPEFIPHTEQILPNQNWTLWGYTDFTDSRWHLGKKYIFFSQDKTKPPNKLGIAHREGWVAYLLDEFMFIKYFQWQDNAVYPDNNVNFETFSNEEMLEIETLGPLVTLNPGEKTSIAEEWELFRNIPYCKTEDDIDKYVLPLVTK